MPQSRWCKITLRSAIAATMTREALANNANASSEAQQTAELRAPLASVYFRIVSPSLPPSRES